MAASPPHPTWWKWNYRQEPAEDLDGNQGLIQWPLSSAIKELAAHNPLYGEEVKQIPWTRFGPEGKCRQFTVDRLRAHRMTATLARNCRSTGYRTAVCNAWIKSAAAHGVKS